ncbi:Shedu anti-phage system protein SduA domain-containing protein [Archangium violaceum]|uniref:Shedu anti-phage system protein SduA domain-containing protein n=1 Tax=Archangium violaceum TaxID=83451 RepID=UPI0009496708|nr:Shedu anti-phage system protein SduA domain-containing protein [Archangium violaceum]
MNQFCRDFENLLKKSPPEEALHQFVVKHPVLLEEFGGPLYISKPSLGRDYTADFAVRTVGNGIFWTFIELERSSHPLFTRQGLPSKALNTAIMQINQWFSWLRDHASPGYGVFDGERSGVVVIGKRDRLSALDLRRLRSFNETHISVRVVTWDTLIDPFKSMSDSLMKAKEREAPKVLGDAEFRMQSAI